MSKVNLAKLMEVLGPPTGAARAPQFGHPAAMVPTFTRKQEQALMLLASQRWVRYGTRITEMRQLKDMGLCYAHNEGPEHPRKAGRWTWRPTPKGLEIADAMLAARKQVDSKESGNG